MTAEGISSPVSTARKTLPETKSFLLGCALRSFSGQPDLALAQRGQQRELQHEGRRDEKHQTARRRLPVEKQAVHGGGDAREREEHAEDDVRVPELIEDRLDEREEVIERPVEHEPRRRRVEKHEEKQRHGIQLHLCFRQAALGEDDAGAQRLIAVMRNGRTLTVTPATVSRPSGAPRSRMGPKDTPVQQLQIREEGVGRR